MPSALQVPWHAVLGNHDYGECWTEESCDQATARCQSIQSPDDAACYLSPLHQVSMDSHDAVTQTQLQKKVYLVLLVKV